MGESAQTGAWGVLHVQRDLLSLGVDSAPMTTDSGIDLLAYDPKSRKSFSIQVKTSGMALGERRPDWKVRKDKLGEADVFAFVLKKKKGDGEAWYLRQSELKRPYVRLYNNEYALTFYRTDAPRGRLNESEMAPFKGREGLQKFLTRLRATGKLVE